MDNDKYFISVDWGTSRFRLRLVECSPLHIVETLTPSGGGVRELYEHWKTNGGDRETLFLDFLHHQVRGLKTPLSGQIKIVISGMASSSLGMQELPYAKLPFAADGKNIIARTLSPASHPAYEILLISGVSSGKDVIRGEETQLIGCLSGEDPGPDLRLLIFPGTHSKHFFVKNNTVFDFSTYMTGEFFQLLSAHSVLSASVEMGQDMYAHGASDSFKKGVRASVNANLLNTAFRVRTHHLFHEMSPKDNFSYLSGLLIGTELQELGKTDISRIYLICGSNLNIPYMAALQELGFQEKTSFYPAAWSDEIVVKGQYVILKNRHLHAG
ncbi:MAG TPA: 2-dehydro-3-deoxygalactonokinase [Puia sp.]